jgi:hypothetical protein
MAFNYSPKIVTNGLVFYLDAANPNSYANGSTNWKDLSRSNINTTLVNGPTFNSSNGGAIVFDGVDDNAPTSFDTALGDFTVCCWFKPTDSSNPAYARMLDKNYQNGFWLGKNASVANSWGGGIREASLPFGIFLTLPDGQWNFLTSIRSSSTHTLYGNGITNTTSNTVPSTALDTTSLLIAQYVGGAGYNYKGSIASLQIYNRALTSTEVLQNYNTTKTRFGY